MAAAVVKIKQKNRDKRELMLARRSSNRDLRLDTFRELGDGITLESNSALMAAQRMGLENLMHLKDTFLHIDVSGDGLISRDELRAPLGDMLGRAVTEDELSGESASSQIVARRPNTEGWCVLPVHVATSQASPPRHPHPERAPSARRACHADQTSSEATTPTGRRTGISRSSC